MADSTITQLPLSPYALDKDLMVVVTGSLEEGVYPRNTKIPLAYIRRYIVRLNLLTNPQSGIGTYYNSGLNILTLQHIPQTGNLMRFDYAKEPPHHQTISTTGLNSLAGNLVDIQFSRNSAAVQTMNSRSGSWPTSYVDEAFYDYFGEPYHSGVISITGLNAYSGAPHGNLMRVDYDGTWPYSGVLSTTGLNSIKGNMIDIQFASASDAASWMHNRDGAWQNLDKNTNLGNKYHSGIISVTGLNAYSGAPYGNLMRVDYDVDQWPYSGVLSTTGLNSIKGNLIDIQFTANSEAALWMHDKNGSWQNLDKNTNLGNKYHSGIISITGLNAYSGAPYGNLMRVDYDVDQWPYSGVLSTTGLNAIMGNGIDIVFNSNSPAAQAMSSRNSNWYHNFDSNTNLGNKYHSGIISVTGLNVYSGGPWGNLMRVDYDGPWPHSGILSTTGLNAIRGNLVDIQFASSSEAASTMDQINGSWYNDFNKNTNLGNKYHSGIISITGVNAVTENNIVKEYQSIWPYSGIYYNTGINAIKGNLVDITYDTDRYRVATLATTGLNMISAHGTAYNISEAYPYDYSIIAIDRSIGKNSYAAFSNDTLNTKTFSEEELTLHFGDLYNTYPNTTIQFLTTLIVGLGSSLGTTQIPSSSSNRSNELAGAPVVGSDYNINNWIAEAVNLVSPGFLTISISGSNVTPITTNKSLSALSSHGADPGIINLNSSSVSNYEDVIEQKSIASIYVNDYGCGDSLSLRPQYALKNIQYTRRYRYSNSGIFHTSPVQTAINTQLIFQHQEGRVLKAEHFYEPPSIIWKQQPNQPVSNIEVDVDNSVVSLTGIAVSTDYTKVKYQWYISSDNLVFVPIQGATNSVLNINVTSTRYFKSLATLYTCDSSFSNVVTVTVPVTDIVCQHPSDVTICDGGTISLSAGASLIGAPAGSSSEITYRWYNGATPLSSGETSNGNYTGTHTSSLTITNADIDYHRGREYSLVSSFYIAPVESSGYITEENDIYNLVTETNQYRLITETSVFSSPQMYSCTSSGAIVWEAFANTLSHPSNYNSIRDYAFFFGSGEAGRTNGTTTDYKTPSYTWQRSANGTGSWQNISSSSFSLNALGAADYEYVIGILGGNIVPPTTLFLNNLTSGNHLDQYRMITSYNCASSTGNPAQLTIEQIIITGEFLEAPILSSYKFPDNIIYNNIILASGNSLNLSVQATAFNSASNLYYQWQSGGFSINNPQTIDTNSWTNMLGQTNSNLSLSNLPETNSGLYRAYRVLIDDQNISSDPTDEITTMRRKISNAIKVGNPAFVADTTSENILYNPSSKQWSITYQGTSNKVDPPRMIISGLRFLDHISYDLSIRSIVDDLTGNKTGYLRIFDVNVPELSSTGTTLSFAQSSEGIDLVANTGIFLSVTGTIGQWFAGFTIPSGINTIVS